MDTCRAIAFAVTFGIAIAAPAALAGGGPFGIDHRVAFDNSGIWNRNVQQDVLGVTILATVGGTFLEGDESRIGRTFAQSLDSLVLSTVGAQAMKRVFSRERPSKTANPDEFFAGGGNQSFPSGEVTAIASAATPFVLEYGHDHPSVYALEALTAYDMVARVKVRGHWQSDVIVGAALGTGFGFYAHNRANPLIVSWLPHGMMLGWTHHF